MSDERAVTVNFNAPVSENAIGRMAARAERAAKWRDGWVSIDGVREDVSYFDGTESEYAAGLDYDDLAETVPAPRTRSPFWLRWLGWLGIGSARNVTAGFVLCLALSACGGAPGALRSTMAAAAHAVDEADRQAEGMYDARADECRDRSPEGPAGWAPYDECMAAMNAAERGLDVAADSLLATEAALDAWDDTAAEGAKWYAFAPCLSRALFHLRGVLEAVGIDLPPAIGQALEMASALGGACTEGE